MLISSITTSNPRSRESSRWTKRWSDPRRSAPTRRIVTPSIVSSGRPPGKREVSSVTWWPHATQRLATSWVNSSAPPACGFATSRQFRIRIRKACRRLPPSVDEREPAPRTRRSASPVGSRRRPYGVEDVAAEEQRGRRRSPSGTACRTRCGSRIGSRPGSAPRRSGDTRAGRPRRAARGRTCIRRRGPGAARRPGRRCGTASCPSACPGRSAGTAPVSGCGRPRRAAA